MSSRVLACDQKLGLRIDDFSAENTIELLTIHPFQLTIVLLGEIQSIGADVRIAQNRVMLKRKTRDFGDRVGTMSLALRSESWQYPAGLMLCD